MSKLVDEEGAATEGINTKQNYIDSQKAQTCSFRLDSV